MIRILKNEIKDSECKDLLTYKIQKFRNSLRIVLNCFWNVYQALSRIQRRKLHLQHQREQHCPSDWTGSGSITNRKAPINNIQLSTLEISQAEYLPDGGDHLDIPIITRVITEWARGLLGGRRLQLQLLDETRVAAGALESLKFRKKIFQIIA